MEQPQPSRRGDLVGALALVLVQVVATGVGLVVVALVVMGADGCSTDAPGFEACAAPTDHAWRVAWVGLVVAWIVTVAGLVGASARGQRRVPWPALGTGLVVASVVAAATLANL